MQATDCHPVQLSIRALNYHVHRWGDDNAPPLFLLHGLLDTGASFAPLAAGLPGRRLIAPDWRGHGDSDRAANGYWLPDYVADLDALVDHFAGPTQPIDIVAHSMGGSVASLYAGLRPERVRRVVFLDSLNVPDTPEQKNPQRYTRWLNAQKSPPPARGYDSLEMLAQRISSQYPELPQQAIEQLAHNWSRPTADGQRQLSSDPHHRLPSPYGFHVDQYEPIWRQVTANVLFIDGGQSPALKWTSKGELARRRACFANSRHIVMSDCGHMLHIQQAATTAEHIASFLDSGCE